MQEMMLNMFWLEQGLLYTHRTNLWTRACIPQQLVIVSLLLWREAAVAAFPLQVESLRKRSAKEKSAGSYK
jgi:hypothetical protein